MVGEWQGYRGGDALALGFEVELSRQVRGRGMSGWGYDVNKGVWERCSRSE